MVAQRLVLRHEPVADAVLADRRQLDALPSHLLAEEAVRYLHEHARPVAHQRIGSHRAAMGEVFQHGEAVADDLVRLDVLHLGDEADAAGIVFVARIVKPLALRQPARRSRFDGARILLAGGNKLRRQRWRQVRHRHVLQ